MTDSMRAIPQEEFWKVLDTTYTPTKNKLNRNNTVIRELTMVRPCLPLALPPLAIDVIVLSAIIPIRTVMVVADMLMAFVPNRRIACLHIYI